MDKLWKVSQKWWMTEINDGVSPWWSDRTLRVHLPCHVQHRRVPSDSQTKLEVQNLDECAAWLCFSVCPRWAVFGQSRWLIHSGLTHEYTTTPVYLQPNPPPKALLSCLILSSLHIPAGWCHPETSPSWFIGVLRPVGSCSAAAEVNDCCQV